MAQPMVKTTDSADPGRAHGRSQSSGPARVAGAAAVAAVTGAIRGRSHGGTHPRAGSAVGPVDAAGPLGAPPGGAADPVGPHVGAVGPATGPRVGAVGPATGPPGGAVGAASPPPAADAPPVFRAIEPDEMDATLVVHNGRWTAQRVLAELPDTPAATVEVLDGSLVVSARRGIRHQTVMLEFGIALKRAARVAGYGVHPQIKVVVGDELVTPDLTVATRLGEDTSCVGAHEVLLVAEVVLTEPGRSGRIDRTPIYAAGKIGHYLRLDFRGHDPVISLHELVAGEYQPLAVASVGARFTTSRPFDFVIDPAQLRPQAQPRVP